MTPIATYSQLKEWLRVDGCSLGWRPATQLGADGFRRTGIVCKKAARTTLEDKHGTARSILEETDLSAMRQYRLCRSLRDRRSKTQASGLRRRSPAAWLLRPARIQSSGNLHDQVRMRAKIPIPQRRGGGSPARLGQNRSRTLTKASAKRTRWAVAGSGASMRISVPL